MDNFLNNDLKFGIQTNGIKHTHLDQMPSVNSRFQMARDAMVFDYVDKTPEFSEIEEFKVSSLKYGLPIRAGGWFYQIGNHRDLLIKNLKIARDLGSIVHNTQIQALNSEGNLVSNIDVRDIYLEAYDIGMKLGVTPCFEIHVNMWSEDFLRVSNVGKLVEDKGVEFNNRFEVVYHLLDFKQNIFNIDKQIISGELIIDPFITGNVVEEWINCGGLDIVMPEQLFQIIH